jgi:hypothetical protein
MCVIFLRKPLISVDTCFRLGVMCQMCDVSVVYADRLCVILDLQETGCPQ